jgi:hypothetical protein
MNCCCSCRSRWGLFAVALCVSAAAGWSLVADSTAPKMTRLADDFVSSLSDAQRAQTIVPYDDPARLDWHFIPKPTRKGLQIKEMNDRQREKAHALLKGCLSEAGYEKAVTIFQLESILAELEKSRDGGPIRDSERYYFTVFSSPSADKRWGLSVEGHHLSLNFVVEKDRVLSTTPAMFGANPAVVQSDYGVGPKKGTRVLAKEEELAFKLVKLLSSEQFTLCRIAEKAPSEVRDAGKPQPPDSAAEGIPAGQLNAEQLDVLKSLIKAYVANMPADLGDQRWAEIEQAGFDTIHFAWAGATEPGVGHYYRLQGKTFLVEFVNTQPDSAGNPANHIHAVWRDVRGDFALHRG